MREWIIPQFIGSSYLFVLRTRASIRFVFQLFGKRIVPLVLLAFGGNYVSGQKGKPIFQSIQQGLSHQIVHAIIKDSYGYLWFGTQDGLNKFDGSNFVVYENSPNDSNSLIHNSIHALIEDKYKNLWIGTSQGLNLYNREKDNFINVDFIKNNVNHLNTTYVSALCADDEGKIWIGTFGNGINVYDYKHYVFSYYIHDTTNNNSVISQYITSLALDDENNIWIGTYDGLDLFDRRTKSFRHIALPSRSNGLNNSYITSLYVDHLGDIWVGTQHEGLYKLLKKNDGYGFTHYEHTGNPNSLSDNYVWSLCEDKKGNLWIGTDKGGLNCLNLKSDKLSCYRSEEGCPNTLSSNSIWSLFVDDNNILWIGAYNKGINVFDEKYQKFELYQRNLFSKNTLPSNDVRSFAEDKQGDVWIGTDGGGICRFNPGTRQFIRLVMSTAGKTLLTKNDVTQVICDSRENIWVGMWSGGVDRLDKNANRVKNFKTGGIQGAGDNNVITLYEDKQKNIWAGTAGSGLFEYNPMQDRFVQITDNSDPLKLLNTAFVASILEDNDDDLWVGTLYGLVCIKKKHSGELSFTRFYHSNKRGSISSDRIITIFEDSRKNLWFGTEDMGLNLYNRRDGTFTVFQKQDGLPNNSIKGILEDSHGNFWISTNKGISRFDPIAKTFRNYTQADGLNSDEFYKSCLKTKTGEFFFGGNKGFNVFYPDSIKNNTLVPPVYLTDLKIFNKSVKIGEKGSPLQKQISLTRKITLTHKQTSFVIEYAALNYTRSSRNQYVYMLKGLDHEWNNAGHNRTATYSNLSPGTYLFMVKGSNNDGLFNPIPTTLEITVLPPYWQTKWAFAVYFLVFFSLLYAFVKLQMIRIKQLQVLRMERMKREKDEELNQLKMQFFTNVSHEFRTPLSLILSPLENIIFGGSLKSELKNQLTIIYKNADRLFRLVNELMDFIKAEDGSLKVAAQSGNIVSFSREISAYYLDAAQRRYIDYQFVAEDSEVEAWFDRDKIEKVLHNLLSNAFKFTPDKGKITLRLEKIRVDDHSINPAAPIGELPFGDYMKISVTDNGSGISPVHISKVFDRFFQSLEEDKLYQTGTGIGLSLTKSLVELHHGKIWVTSEKWKETCFTVLLPLGSAHFNPDEMVSMSVGISVWHSHQAAFEPGQKEIKNRKSQENLPLILVVEDNIELRNYIVSVLLVSYNVLEATNGKQGIEMVLEHLPDLIVSDIIMPEMSGIELCRKIKEEISTSHIPVVLLTAKNAVESRLEGIETGADAYITKPFNVRILEATLKNLIETRQKLFQRFSQEAFIMPKELSNNPIDQDFLERIIGYIDKNMADESLSVEKLASHLLMSRSQTYRKIKALTGQSATEFLRTVRLKKAIKLMESGELNISEIAFKIGFSSPAYFTKCFKEHFGKLPSEYLPESGKKKKIEPF
jgi:ligand-binding sensor domain-containing protein/signal transduction histidine kinase/DNA-binding response OmpR family regulator